MSKEELYPWKVYRATANKAILKKPDVLIACCDTKEKAQAVEKGLKRCCIERYYIEGPEPTFLIQTFESTRDGNEFKYIERSVEDVLSLVRKLLTSSLNISPITISKEEHE